MCVTPTVIAVVVTHNRRDLLTESLTALAAQSRTPDSVIVVDNASTDGTAALVRERFPGVRLLELPDNIGGAGGFAAGIADALSLDPTYIWLLDDDTVPSATALDTALSAFAAAPGAVLVASRVQWTDGRDHPMNTPRPRRSRDALPPDCVRIRSASFVSTLIAAEAARATDLPIADYFLWNDDFEYTARLLRGRLGLLCRASVVTHKTAVYGSTDADPGSRFYYEVRNKLWLFTRSRALGPAERLLFAGATLRRWLRTYARSADRAVLRRELVRGLSAGLRTRPRSTRAVLASSPSRRTARSD